MRRRLEGIDTKDTESRLKLNKKLGTKFNRDVSDKTYEIKEQVGDCEGFGCADSLSQRRNRRAEREKAAADVGCVFGVRVFADHRGIVRARVLPVWFAWCFVVMGVVFLSFIKRLLMIPIEDGAEQRGSTRSRSGSQVLSTSFGSFGRSFQKSFQKSIAASRASIVASVQQAEKGLESDSVSTEDVEIDEEEEEEEFDCVVC